MMSKIIIHSCSVSRGRIAEQTGNKRRQVALNHLFLYKLELGFGFLLWFAENMVWSNV